MLFVYQNDPIIHRSKVALQEDSFYSVLNMSIFFTNSGGFLSSTTANMLLRKTFQYLAKVFPTVIYKLLDNLLGKYADALELFHWISISSYFCLSLL